jgi:hypothetical protein
MSRPRTAAELRALVAGWPAAHIRTACVAALPEEPDLALVVALWLSGFDSPAGRPPLEPEQVAAIADALTRRLM